MKLLSASHVIRVTLNWCGSELFCHNNFHFEEYVVVWSVTQENPNISDEHSVHLQGGRANQARYHQK
jgi:hypothetical protein